MARLLEGQSEEQILSKLEEAITAGVIQEVYGRVGYYHFVHALVQETLIEELTLTRRVRVHAAVALSTKDRPTELLLKAFNHYMKAGAAEKAVAAASCPIFFVWTQQVCGLAEMVQRALALVGEDTYDRGVLLSQYGYYLYIERGDLKAADALDLAQRVRAHRAWLVCVLAYALYKATGDWRGALEMLERELAVGIEEDSIRDRALIEVELGNFDEAERCVDRLLKQAWLDPEKLEPSIGAGQVAQTICVLARITGDFSCLDVAQRIAQSILSQNPPWLSVRLFSVCALAMSAILRGDRDEAVRRYQELTSMPSFHLSLFGVSHDRLRGLLADASGREDKARQHLDTAIQFLRASGYHPELA